MGENLTVLSAREHDDPDDEGTVGLVRFTGSLDGHGPVGVDVDYLASFVEQCREMDWDEVTLYLREDDVVLAHERGEAHGGIFAALAPFVPAEGVEDGE